MKRVVITGLGCISPVGNDIKTFWESLTQGKHGFSEITKFDASNMKAKIAGEVKNFSPENYIEKSEIKRTELYCQYAIAAATEAMDDSKLADSVSPERFGVYIGSGIGGLGTMVAQTETMLNRGPDRISPFLIPMMIANMASGLVAMRYNARGVNLPVVSACATATHAIGEAFRAIKFGYADAILAGGAEASINMLGIGAFTTALALSTASDPDNASIPFDMRRNGFIMGEGAGVLVLEEYERAVKRSAKIYCEISGYGNTCDAFHITSPRPDAAETSRMIKLALEESQLLPDEKIYINAHGTSTPLNDKSETLAIKKALGEELAYKIPISSTKSMTGHMLGAAGAVEAIAAVKALETGIVPPTIGYKEPDPECDLYYVPNTARTFDANKALSLSLGFGGHNAGILFNKPEVRNENN
ncbi:MAG: beta-ketoacyl-ACP synthase II [Defluviitaleaceae bacterium]|nr:beta-ketoacyl-ACP synthase II [Defluviitaleaceae bacterium]